MYQTVNNIKLTCETPSAACQRSEPMLLVAMPSQTDPDFRQSVVFLAENSPHGSLGFVINRPSSEKMGEILCNSGSRLPAMLTTWYGGPVEPDTGIILHTQPELGTEEKLTDSLYICSSIDTLVQLMQAEEENRNGPIMMSMSDEPTMMSPIVFRQKRLYQFRFVMGCAAWGPGQLEREMRMGQWITVPYSEELLFNVPWKDLVDVALNNAGIKPNTLAPVSQRFLA